MKRLLIVEDDADLGRGISLALRDRETQCENCRDIKGAREKLMEQSFDLVLLDINLPDGSGLDLLAELKAAYRMPVILLTANDTEMDMVAGLEAGADDYITKPFGLAVLRARIHARLRNSGQTVFRQKDYRFDFEHMEFYHGDRQVELSKTEQKALRILVENAGMTVSRSVMVDRIWTDGADYVDENALSVTIKRLRDKLSAGGYIKTVYGLGYTWEKE